MDYKAKLVLGYEDDKLSGESHGSIASLAFMLSLAMEQSSDFAMAVKIAQGYHNFAKNGSVEGTEVESFKKAL